MSISTIILTALALIPAAGLMFYVYKMDRVEKEPAGLLVGLFFLGVGSVVPAIILELLLHSCLNAVFFGVFSAGDPYFYSEVTKFFYNLIYAFVVVALVEEGCKFFFMFILTHKNKKNEGELPQYIIENSHPAIIPEETWELVQLEMERRRRMGNRFSAKGPLASRLVCADCGAFFGAKVWHSQDRYRTTVWRCNDKYSPNAKRVSGGEKCSTGHVTEGQVYEAFQGIVNKLIAQRPEVVEACEAVLGDLMNTADLDAKKERLEAEQKRITGKVEALMNKASREVVGDFTEQYAVLEAEMKRVTGK